MRSHWRCPSRLASHAELTQDENDRWRRANAGMLWILLTMALCLALMAWRTDWDLVVADAAFNQQAKAFPWRHAWLTEQFNHVILKRLFTTAGLGFVAVAVWDFLAPQRWSWLRRYQLRVVALAAVAVPAAISLIKQMSDSHCPWDLQRYGGTEPYIRLFDALPAGLAPGQCMPAGHASSALWMIAIAIFFIPRRLAQGGAVLAGFLALGLGVGWLQQLRGAHFLSHTLWSAWVALATVMLIATCLDRWPVRAGPLPIAGNDLTGSKPG